MILLSIHYPLAAILWIGFLILLAGYILFSVKQVRDPKNYIETDSSEKDTIEAKSKNDAPENNSLEELKKIVSWKNIECPVLQLHIENTTDQTKTCTLLELFSRNPEGVKLEASYVDELDIDFIKRWFLINPSKSGIIRIYGESLSGRQVEQVIRSIGKDPFGRTVLSPAITPIDDIKEGQFQYNIIEKAYEMDLDGLSQDFQFKLLPKQSLRFSIFIGQTQTLRKFELAELMPKSAEPKVNNCQHVCGIILENLSDETRTVDLFDPLVPTPDGVTKYDLYSGEPFSRVVEQYSHNTYKVNSIRVFISNTDDGSKNLRQIYEPIKFTKSGKEYKPTDMPNWDSNFQNSLIDINFPEHEEIGKEASAIVKVQPNTRVIYLFKRYNNKIGGYTINRNISSDQKTNDTEERLSVELFASEEVKAKADNKQESSAARIEFSSIEQMEEPIIVERGVEGYNNTEIIYPLAHTSVYSCKGDKSIFIPDFKFIVNGYSRILAVFPKKDDFIDVSLYKSPEPEPISEQDTSESDYPFIERKGNSFGSSKCFPIWLSNTTDEEKTIVLVNNILDYLKPEYALTEGVKMTVKNGEDWGDLLRGIEATNTFKSVQFRRVYSRITSKFPIIDEIEISNKQGEKVYSLNFPYGGLHNYISAHQYIPQIIDIPTNHGYNSPYSLPFKNEDGELINAAMTVKLKPQSHIAIFVELEPC